MPSKEVYYGDYLALDKILNAGRPLSGEHDETLFIVVHQVYELWFKQILHELISIQSIFAKDYVEEGDLACALSRLSRIKKIQGLLLSQLEVMESMAPMDFLEFRDLLSPASGFQSRQFREVALRMGQVTQKKNRDKSKVSAHNLGQIEGKQAGATEACSPHVARSDSAVDPQDGLKCEQLETPPFMRRLSKTDQKHLHEIARLPNLCKQLENWLARMPFSRHQYFDFWKEYRRGVESMLGHDQKTIEANRARLSPEEQAFQLSHLKLTQEMFSSLFEESEYQKWQSQGRLRWSQQAFFNALFIFVYRHEGLLHLPYLCLATIAEIDQNWVTWRYRHALMAEYFLGSKIGTGGSSGQEFLLKRAEEGRIYTDFSLLTTLLIPQKFLPPLPEELQRELNFKA